MNRTTPIERELVKLTAGDKEASDNFGGAVSIYGKYAIVGAMNEDTDGSNAGAAYIFVQNDDLSWTQVSKLQANNVAANANFGCAVAINEQYAFVGALNEDTSASNAGSVYVFKQIVEGSWDQIQQLQASDKQANDNFGGAIALSNTAVVIGATGEDTNGNTSGAAYIFELDAGTELWNEAKKLKGSDAKAYDNFGNAVAIDGNTAIVGAYLLSPEGTSDAGACYIYERNVAGNWQEVQRINASDKEASDNFGISVGIDGNFAAIGASGEDNAYSNAGAVYIFERATDGQWDERAKLQASDKQANNYFGCSVGISGDTVIVGATGKDETNKDIGGAYLYRITDGIWSQAAILVSSDRQASDQMGNSVSISAGFALVGAQLHDSSDSDAGATYVFETGGNGETGGGNGSVGGSLSEGLLTQIVGGPEFAGHSGDDAGSFPCDGKQKTCLKLPGLKGVKAIAMWVKITGSVGYLLDARDPINEGLGLANGYIYSSDFGPDWTTLYVDGVQLQANRGSYDDIPKGQWTHVYIETETAFDDHTNFMSNYVEGENLEGSIDEVRVYNRALTGEEIAELANA